MKCIKCETEMTKSRLSTGPAIVFAENCGKGFIPKVKKSPISCYVCSKCGYIELNADEPQNMQNNN